MTSTSHPAAGPAPSAQPAKESQLTSGVAIVAAIALVKLALHLWANRGYGYFRDELYYLACAEHLDWGYVDHPPLVALHGWLGRYLFGESLSGIRFLPAVAGATKVLLAGVIARQLGGGRFAQGLAALATLVAPIYLGIDNFLSMNAFEPVYWMGCIAVLIRMIQTDDAKLWLWFGALAGLGLENKHSTLFFGFAVVVALLLTPERCLLASKWLWLGGAVAFAVFLPNFVWQVRHDFATLELLRNVKSSAKNIVLTPWQFFAQQILIMHPANAPVWLAGLAYFFFGREGRRWRVLGWTYVLLLATFIFLEGKIYYLAPIYPMLFAGGAIAIEQFVECSGRARLRPAIAGVLAVAGVLFAPIALPLLPPARYLAYARAVHVEPPRTERSHTAALPQLFADQFGWEEMTAAVARIYHALPPEERAKTAIFGNNYGEAGAIDFFGPRYGLPKAISAHQNYFFWGPREYTGEIVIVLGGRREDLEGQFEHVEEVARLDHPYAMPFENRPIYLCRRLKTPLPVLWPRLKRWL